MAQLVKYEAACRALAEAKRVDEVKKIRDVSEAARLYARQAKNKELEIDAAEIRMRAEIRLGEMLRPAKAAGQIHPGQPKKNGNEKEPFSRVRLSEIGIDKKLSSRASKMAAVPEEKREGMIAEWRERVSRENERVTTNLLREGEREQRESSLKSMAKPLPAGKFDVLYGDPPWRYEHPVSESRAIENQYPTMTLGEIQGLKVPAADDCVLFLWATSPKVAEAMSVIDAWEFLYRTCAVWVKDKIGMGYYFRQQHELLLVATKGSPGTPEPSERCSSVIHAPRGKRHSEKPSEVYDLIESLYPEGRRCELWARTEREGWDRWGYEA